MPEITDLNEATLLNLIEELNQQKEQFNYQVGKIKLEDLEKLNEEEITAIFNNNDVTNEETINKVIQYIQFTSKFFNILNIFQSNIKELKRKAESAISIINENIDKKNNKNKEEIEKIDKKIYIITQIYNYLYKPNSNVNIIEVINNLEISDQEKIELSIKIARMNIELSKNRTNVENKNDIEEITYENAGLVNQLLEKYKDIFEKEGLGTKLLVIEDNYEEALNLKNIDESDTIMYIFSLVAEIQNCSAEEKDKYLELIKKFEDKLDSIRKIDPSILINNIGKIENQLRIIYQSQDYQKLDQEQIAKIQSETIKIRNKYNNENYKPNPEEFRKDIETISCFLVDLMTMVDVQKNPEQEETKHQIKGFILNDYAKKENYPYILTDLDPSNTRNMIDQGVNQKIQIACQDLSKMVKDIFYLGDMEESLNANTSSDNTLNKLISQVTSQKGSKEKTGMYRIKPSTSSCARIIEKKYVLHHETKLFEQLTSIIMECLPQAKIDSKEDFKLYINFVSALKAGDESCYGEAKKRYNQSKLRKLLESAIEKEKRGLTAEEEEIFRKIINASINSFNQLENLNEKCKFEFDLDKIQIKQSEERNKQ